MRCHILKVRTCRLGCNGVQALHYLTPDWLTLLPPRPAQAFERQVDSLSRQLSQAEADGEELVRQREALLEEIRAAQQVGRNDRRRL